MSVSASKIWNESNHTKIVKNALISLFPNMSDWIDKTMKQMTYYAQTEK